jgi:hypothetical protein
LVQPRRWKGVTEHREHPQIRLHDVNLEPAFDKQTRQFSGPRPHVGDTGRR